MISHTTIGTNDLDKADAFYSEVLTAIGGHQIYKSDNVIFWEFKSGGSKLAITLPFDGDKATAGNGTMVAFTLASVEQVERVYLVALRLGAKCEGQPGKRNDGSFFGAYFRDLDGNKIAIFYRKSHRQ